MKSRFAAQASARRKLMVLATGRKPRRGPMPKQLQPNAIRLSYTSALRSVIETARELVNQHLVPMLPQLVDVAAQVHDAIGPLNYPAAVDAALDAIAEEFFRAWPNERLREMARKFAGRTADFQRDQLARQMKSAIGIDVAGLEPRMGDLLDTFADANVSLIKSVPERYFGELKTQVVQGLRQGKRAEDLAADIADRYGVADSRAQLIARDQIGKIFGELNKARQEALGVNGFVWRTAEDERVRPEHEELDGEYFDWSDPPGEGIPGTPINCRCIAEPDVSALLDDLA